ncbi:DinB family protein [Flagellimonas flava]|uniref:DinB superfamily protein n=1 Tax=Flagellimonas flava TaxID=570519 RepID=A0A1M5LRY0_9FLAO|nr:DinB family protein [Allomuricauda flava]SHG67847.1 DinB superfamily protein [Allomuricauda flava]
MNTSDLKSIEYDPYYQRYLDKVPQGTELKEGFKKGGDNILTFFNSIPQEKHNHAYQFGKWTIKEVLQHLIDTERIFMHRCFRIARADKTPLSSFDQNIYVEPSHANVKTMAALLEEFRINRLASINLLNSFTDEDLEQIGNANSGAMSARAAAFTIIGHDIWHTEIVEQKYL